MGDIQLVVLKAVKQLKEADLTAISDYVNIPPLVAKGVCNYLTRCGYLVETEGNYKITLKGNSLLYEREKEIVIK